MSEKQISFDLIPFDCDRPAPFFNLISKNKERLRHSFPGTLSQNLSLAHTMEYCSANKKKWSAKTYLPYLILESDTRDYIGMIDLKKIEWKIPKAEIGYFIDNEYEGKGITSRAVGHFIETIVKDFGFKKLISRVHTENIGSQKVALNNGFELEGTMRNDHLTLDGELVDIYYFGKIF